MRGRICLGFSAFLRVLKGKWNTVLDRWMSSSETFCLKFDSMLCDGFYTDHAGSGNLFLFSV